MAKQPSKVKYARYSFTVPENDSDVLAWLAAQNNVSISLRAIIKDAIKRDGNIDVFCKPIVNPGVTPGRPVKDRTEETIEMKPQVEREIVEIPVQTQTETPVVPEQPMYGAANGFGSTVSSGKAEPVQTPQTQESGNKALAANEALASMLG